MSMPLRLAPRVDMPPMDPVRLGFLNEFGPRADQDEAVSLVDMPKGCSLVYSGDSGVLASEEEPDEEIPTGPRPCSRPALRPPPSDEPVSHPLPKVTDDVVPVVVKNGELLDRLGENISRP